MKTHNHQLTTYQKLQLRAANSQRFPTMSRWPFPLKLAAVDIRDIPSAARLTDMNRGLRSDPVRGRRGSMPEWLMPRWSRPRASIASIARVTSEQTTTAIWGHPVTPKLVRVGFGLSGDVLRRSLWKSAGKQRDFLHSGIGETPAVYLILFTEYCSQICYIVLDDFQRARNPRTWTSFDRTAVRLISTSVVHFRY